jgi:N-acetylglucosamine malate deacetylase 1
MSGKRILVVAAHPDDEVLGCGAAIAGHARLGDEVHLVIMAEGATSRDDSREPALRGEELARLAQSAHRACAILGASSLTLCGEPDNRLDSVELLDLVKIVEREIELHRPEIVYTHHAGDLNIDHRIVHSATVTACRPQPGHPVKTLLFFEVPSSTEWQSPGSAPAFLPNWFVDASDTLELKLQALQAYGSEMRPWPHARSLEGIEHLARWRGCSVGWEAAEAFQIGRHLITGR